MLLKAFSDSTGYSVGALNAKIDKGDWIEGEVWCYSPDGRRQI